jgi:hypothetical protein
MLEKKAANKAGEKRGDADPAPPDLFAEIVERDWPPIGFSFEKA